MVLLLDFKKCLGTVAYPILSTSQSEFMICLPCKTVAETSAPMSAELATYAMLYFLSSLVRYHPDYMDAIAQSSDAWLIESFVKSAPLDLMRSLTARVLGYSLVMERSR
jgi:hypothetical protein